MRDCCRSLGEWSLISCESTIPKSTLENYSLYLSSSLLSTLSPASWGRAEESVVRTKRMVEPVEDKEEENFFCGPPGKLPHGQS